MNQKFVKIMTWLDIQEKSCHFSFHWVSKCMPIMSKIKEVCISVVIVVVVVVFVVVVVVVVFFL